MIQENFLMGHLSVFSFRNYLAGNLPRGIERQMFLKEWLFPDELGFTYQYEATDMEGLLGGLQNGRFDVALGAISITPSRERLVDFTQAVNPSGTGIAVAKDSIKNAFQLYWKPILVSLLRLIGLLLLVLLISGTLVWLVELTSKHSQFDRKISGLADGL